MRIALIHDWLVTYGGAERVLEQMILELQLLGDVELFTMIDTLPADQRDFLRGVTVRQSALRRLPFARTRYRGWLPVMPVLVEQFDLAAYDLVISSSHAVAKGVLARPDALHICMCYSPMRYAWDLQGQYLRESGLDRGLKSIVARYLLHRMRAWDVRSAAGVDEFIAISAFIRQRIARAWRRDSVVIHPPVDLSHFQPVAEPRRTEYVTAGRLVPYKRVDLMLEAFRRLPHERLTVIGDGPERARLARACPPNVQLVGRQSPEALRDALQHAKAFLFAAEEDFGIAPLEAQACGTPVIAYGRGAARETLRVAPGPKPSAVLFDEQTPESVVAAIEGFAAAAPQLRSEYCRDNADRFGIERFRREFGGFVRDRLEDWRRRTALPA